MRSTKAQHAADAAQETEQATAALRAATVPARKQQLDAMLARTFAELDAGKSFSAEEAFARVMRSQEQWKLSASGS